MAATGLTTTISTKGQLILPKAIRDRLQWDAGTRLAVEHTADGVLLKPLAAAFANPAGRRFRPPLLCRPSEVGRRHGSRDCDGGQTPACARAMLTSSSVT